MINRKRIKFGDFLIEKNLIAKEQLNEALTIQDEQGGKIGQILVNLGIITEEQMLKELSKQLNLKFVDIEYYDINEEMALKISEKIARRFKVLVMDFVDDKYVAGMCDPTDEQAIDEISKHLDYPIERVLIKEKSFSHILDHIYRKTEDIVAYAKELEEELGVSITGLESYAKLGGDSAPVAKLLDSIFEDAVQVGASDIHIAPGKNKFLIRQRIDGVLHENILHGTEIVSALVLRVKLMAQLDISEKRLPQDGRFYVTIKGHKIDVRVSTVPVKYGESVVMRLLDQSLGLLELEDIGFSASALKQLDYLITRPSGLILVTGPTGSGKTTTLYAILSKINSSEKNIITIEDPIEYTLPRINQVQVHNSIGLTFPKILRSSLRQDPDIIMVGEMRDEETVSVGLRASITGHLVLSTLHTNDAVSSAIRLLDMGAKGYLVGAALKAIISQRLVRVLCDFCKEDKNLTEKEKKWASMLFGEIDPSWKFMVGKGCARCNKTGFTGRVAVYEILEMDENLIKALKMADNINFAKQARKQKTYKPLTIAALKLALKGKTSIQEVLKVASEIEYIADIKDDLAKLGKSDVGKD